MLSLSGSVVFILSFVRQMLNWEDAVNDCLFSRSTLIYRRYRINRWTLQTSNLPHKHTHTSGIASEAEESQDAPEVLECKSGVFHLNSSVTWAFGCVWVADSRRLGFSDSYTLASFHWACKHVAELMLSIVMLANSADASTSVFISSRTQPPAKRCHTLMKLFEYPWRVAKKQHCRRNARRFLSSNND